MSGFGMQVAKWAPIILRYLPQIIKVGHDIYGLWCTIRNDKQENATVIKSMKLLNQHKDDIERLLEDPAQKRELLEGLTILMNRISEHDRRQGSQNGAFPPSSPSMGHFSAAAAGACGVSSLSPSDKGFSSSSSFPEFSGKGGCSGVCKVCYRDYDMANRKPVLLGCGHTFCRECLENEERYRRRLCCPMCKAPENRSLAALPLNYALIELRDEEQDDDQCCKKGASGDSSCDIVSQSFEQQIEYVLQLSQQSTATHGADSVERKWREVEEREDEMLARALQDSLIFEASRQCAEQQSEGASAGGCCSDKEWEEDECGKGKVDQVDCASSECAKGKWDDGYCGKGWKDTCDKKCSAFLEEEEELLLQMAIRASLEMQEEQHTAHSDQE